MKFISFFFLVYCVFFVSCKKNTKVVSDVPAYKLIIDFSENIRNDKKLVLYRYGVNNNLPGSYEIINGLANFSVAYVLFKEKDGLVTLEQAREILVFIVERFLLEINSSEEIRSELDFFPFTNDLLNVSLYFKDKNKIDLGNGIAYVCFSNGNIKYEKYDIEEYREVYPAIGKHSIIHQESYQDALNIVKRSNHIDQIQEQKL